MGSELGKRSVRLRGQVIERRFADGKLHRNQGVQNGRGLSRVYAEVGLMAVAQNTLRFTTEKNHALMLPPKLDGLFSLDTSAAKNSTSSI